jgi:hypothetical protein
MSSDALSAQQGGTQPYRYTGATSPKSLGSTNMSTAGARTAWANDSNPYGTPAPLSKQTSGSFYKWDDGGGAAQPVRPA